MFLFQFHKHRRNIYYNQPFTQKQNLTYQKKQNIIRVIYKRHQEQDKKKIV